MAIGAVTACKEIWNTLASFIFGINFAQITNTTMLIIVNSSSLNNVMLTGSNSTRTMNNAEMSFGDSLAIAPSGIVRGSCDNFFSAYSKVITWPLILVT